MKPRCICAGILCADIACWPIHHLPVAGELVETEKIELCLGGCAANVALDLSRLEVPVYLSGCVGDDVFSDFVVKAVSAPGVDCSFLQKVKDNCPGTVMHVNVQGQDRRFICATGANDLYTLDEALENLITSSDFPKGEPKVFYLGGFLMLKNLENERTPKLLKKAQEHGWKTILDVVLYGNRSYKDAVLPLLPFVDVFMPNNHEGEKISGLPDSLDQAKFFADCGAKTSVITQGELGTLYYGEKEKFHAEIFPVDFVGGAGSGDAFAAGFITAMLENRSSEECVVYGSALGASCVRGISTTGSVFTKSELADFLVANRCVIKVVGSGK